MDLEVSAEHSPMSGIDEYLIHNYPHPVRVMWTSDPRAYERLWFTAQDKVGEVLDRKSTRLNSSHLVISYAVFCLKKKKQLGVANICSRRRRVQQNEHRYLVAMPPSR